MTLQKHPDRCPPLYDWAGAQPALNLHDCTYVWARARERARPGTKEKGVRYDSARHRADLVFKRVRPPNAKVSTVERVFRESVDHWKSETVHLSSVAKIISRPSYLRIVGLGKPVLPLLIKELTDSPDHWFAALEAITGDNPVSSKATFDQAVQSWAEWWNQQQQIAHAGEFGHTAIKFNEVAVAGNAFVFAAPVEGDMFHEEGLWYLESKPFSILSFGQTKTDALHSFRSDFVAVWENIAEASDADLTSSAVAVKAALRSAVQSFTLSEPLGGAS